MKKKSEFEAPYIGIETIDNTPIFYNRRGDYSVIIKCENPIIQYSADLDAYYDFHHLFTNILKVLGTGYTIQKQDILCKKSFLPPQNRKNDYLSNRYFEHFKGRIYTDISTYLVITGEVERSKFFSFDPRRFDTFIRNITKVLGLFANRGIRAKLLNENEIEIYIKRFLSINFNQQTVSLKNIKAREENLIIGEKNVQCISLVDIDEVNFPSIIKPYKEVNIGLRFPVDLLSFLHDTPSIDTIIYNQVINIPDQRNEANKLEGKKKKHKGMPDPANDLCVEDIERVQSDIAREGQMLVYAHYNIILAGLDDISKAINYVETSLFDCGIIINKQCFNQLELFECALPGNAINLNSYDKFLTTSDAAICLLFKEKLQVTENSPFLTYFTDRQGLPVGIDMSGKEGEKKYTNNSNFFVLGPSGSGKSFYVNSKVRQWVLDNTDIVLVDTGHSYSGMCEYYHGKYITYSESKPISMIAGLYVYVVAKVKMIMFNIIEFIVVTFWQVCTYFVFFLQIIFTGILVILGPLAFAFSVLPAFRDAYIQWIARFVSVSLYSCIAYIVLSISLVVMQYGIEREIEILEYALRNEAAFVMYVGMTSGGVNSFLLTALLGAFAMLTIPFVSTWIVSTTGVGQAVGGMVGGAAIATKAVAAPATGGASAAM